MLESALTTSGLMQQDVMRGVLEAKPADRYRHITTVLGLGQLEEFEEAARSLARDASSREGAARTDRDRIADSLRSAREKLAAAQSRLESRPQVEALREEVRSLLNDPPPSLIGPPRDIDLESQNAVRAMATQLGAALDALTQLNASTRRALDMRTSLPPEPTEAEMEVLRAEFEAAESELESAGTRSTAAQDQLRTARRASEELAQLAALAIPQLTEACPVCGQAIDPAHVEAELRERAGGTQTIVSLQAAVATYRSGVETAASRVATARAAIDEAQRQGGLWSQFRSAENEASSRLSQLQLGDLVVRPIATTLDDFAQNAEPIAEYLQSRRSRLLEFLNTFDQQTDRGAVERASAETKNLETALASSEATLKDETARTSRLQLLADQSVGARVEVTEKRVNAMQPLVANIFQRLDPHPAFKTIEFELDTYYRRGTTSPLVRDMVEGVSADPLVVFSTSQANIVALSYFIAMSLSAGERGLPFLLLDDPVQSMDDVNVLGFADLCRHLQSRRQLIVSTHERRFAGLLERKLAPRMADSSTKLIRFTGWDRSGPTVDQGTIEPQLVDEPIRVVHLAG